MARIMQSLLVPIVLYTLTLVSCKSKESIDTKNVFEKASLNDSLSFYFPSILNDTIGRPPMYKDFKQNWYSSSLYSFKEPILFNKTDSQTIYRLLWLRSFHRPVCFSVKEFKGKYFLNAKVLDRHPAFYPEIDHRGIDGNTGKEIIDTTQKADRFALIVFDTIKILTTEQWRQIENHLTNLNFWKGPVADPNDQNSTDGAYWVIEARKDKKYHFIDRQNVKGELIPFGKYLIKLSGVKIRDDAIY